MGETIERKITKRNSDFSVEELPLFKETVKEKKRKKINKKALHDFKTMISKIRKGGLIL